MAPPQPPPISEPRPPRLRPRILNQNALQFFPLTILLVFILPSITISVHALHPYGLTTLDPTSFPSVLSRRQTSCSDPSNSRCPSPAQRFCCPSSAECIPLNNATSMICCPSGEDCSFIQPIKCTTSLSKCGSNGQCCPLGYDCDSSTGGCKLQDENKPESYKLRDECAKLNEQSGQQGPSETCMELIEATKKTCLQGCEQFPVKAIVTGFFPGLAVGAAVMFLIGLWMRRSEMRAMERGGPGGGGGGRGGDGGDKHSTGESYKDGASVNVLGTPSSGFAAARASRRATMAGGDYASHHGSVASGGHRPGNQRARSIGAATTLSTTEIAIGYDRKQDEQFSLVSGASGRGTPASGSIVTSPTPPPPPLTAQQQQAPLPTPALARGNSGGGYSVGGAVRGYDGDLRSPRHFIAEELTGSTPSVELDTIPANAAASNSTSTSTSTTRGAVAAAAAAAAAAGKRVAPPHVQRTMSPPPLPTTIAANRTTPSPASSHFHNNQQQHYKHVSIPLVPLDPASTARKPLPAPLTHEHLLQHQQQQQQQQQHLPTAPLAPNAQSEYHSSESGSSATNSFASTVLSHSDSDSDSDSEGPTTAAEGTATATTGAGGPPGGSYQPITTKQKQKSKHPKHKKLKSKPSSSKPKKSGKPPRPPSDVTSCITDGDHDDGLTTFEELAAAGVVYLPSSGGGAGGSAGLESPFIGEGERERESVGDSRERERVAVDWRKPPPLPEGYEFLSSSSSRAGGGEGSSRVVVKGAGGR